MLFFASVASDERMEKVREKFGKLQKNRTFAMQKGALAQWPQHLLKNKKI